RCDDFIPDVRAQHIRYFGPRASWWYGIGQLRQESNCRAKATAWDQGMGIAQFMPATAKEINRLMKTNLDPYNPEHAIRMQAYYMSSLHRQNWDEQKRLWLTYQAYNGGYGNLKSEYRRAGKVDWLAMKENCKRRKVTLKSGQVLDFCEVNYDYSVKVHKYGKVYRSQNIDQIKFW
ncbi:MAG TPA: lytic transglycosylase domain-containing protein, partial [Bacteroidales bacterium]|nr:lytic transglycosylase domain-containing protein [Bacteroidales bacterium]